MVLDSTYLLHGFPLRSIRSGVHFGGHLSVVRPSRMVDPVAALLDAPVAIGFCHDLIVLVVEGSHSCLADADCRFRHDGRDLVSFRIGTVIERCFIFSHCVQPGTGSG